MKASDPDYEEINDLQTKLTMLANPTMVLGCGKCDLPAAELSAIKQTILDKLGEILAWQDSPFNDWLKQVAEMR